MVASLYLDPTMLVDLSTKNAGGVAFSEAVARVFPRFFAAIAGPPSSLDLSRLSL